jgi:cytochrome oxidase Cu insertion factor (SCO1/SenC/PrrC family)
MMQGLGRLYATLLAVSFLGCASPEERAAQKQEREFEARQHEMVAKLTNRPAPDFELTALDGPKVKLSDSRGKPVVLAFFAYG